jgi:AcrR family transcriptional regulator
MLAFMQRAAPLAPEHRREAILAAVMPVLVERGASVTSRELAAAAGVAEGTIFKAFTDKEQLLAAALARAIDPTQYSDAIRAIDPALPFEERLVRAAEVMQRRLVVLWTLISQLSHAARPESRRWPDNPALTALFEADAARVRLDPAEAARRFRAVVLALSYPDIVDPVAPAEIVEAFLRGFGQRP